MIPYYAPTHLPVLGYYNLKLWTIYILYTPSYDSPNSHNKLKVLSCLYSSKFKPGTQVEMAINHGQQLMATQQ